MNHQEKLAQDHQVWRKRIEDLNASGLTVSQYGKVNELSVHQIYYWKAKFSDVQNKSSTSPKVSAVSPLVKVVHKAEVKSTKLPDARWVAELIKAIHESF